MHKGGALARLCLLPPARHSVGSEDISKVHTPFKPHFTGKGQRIFTAGEMRVSENREGGASFVSGCQLPDGVAGTMARPPAPVHTLKPWASGGVSTALALSFLSLGLRSQVFVSLTGMLGDGEPRILLFPLQEGSFLKYPCGCFRLSFRILLKCQVLREAVPGPLPKRGAASHFITLQPLLCCTL